MTKLAGSTTILSRPDICLLIRQLEAGSDIRRKALYLAIKYFFPVAQVRLISEGSLLNVTRIACFSCLTSELNAWLLWKKCCECKREPCTQCQEPRFTRESDSALRANHRYQGRSGNHPWMWDQGRKQTRGSWLGQAGSGSGSKIWDSHPSSEELLCRAEAASSVQLQGIRGRF